MHTMPIERATLNDFKCPKAASLVKLSKAELPVPDTYFILTSAFELFYNANKRHIEEILLAVDPKSSVQIEEVQGEMLKLFLTKKIEPGLQKEIIDKYAEMGRPFVAVRSANWAEWIEPSVGQKTYLNVKGDKALLENIRRCWAFFFDANTILNMLRTKSKPQVIVIVQKMVIAQKGGVALTTEPNGENACLIEAAFGLPAGVTSGIATPDSYVVSKKDHTLMRKRIASKKYMLIKHPKTGETRKVKVEKAMQEAQVMTEEDLKTLAQLCGRIEHLYTSPQEIEWGMMDSKAYMLESRPLTIVAGKGKILKSANLLAQGISASAGTVSGRLRIVKSAEDAELVGTGDIVFTSLITPDMVNRIKNAAGFIFHGGGVTSHAATLSREMMKPCVIMLDELNLTPGMMITLDGNSGCVYEGVVQPESKASRSSELKTRTKVKVNISLPENAPMASKIGADGVGLLRAKLMILELGAHPMKFISSGRSDEFSQKMAERIATVAKEFYPREVTYRCLDMPTNELRALEGGSAEPMEQNPMLGWRGIKRSLDQPELFRAELRAIKLVHDMGYGNVQIMFPMVRFGHEVKQAKKILKEVGLETNNGVKLGIMIETPVSALNIDEFLKEKIDFISFGTNDLTQYVMAVDRNDSKMAEYYLPNNTAVLKLIEHVIRACKKTKTKTSICGKAASDPFFLGEIIRMGIDEISVDVDDFQKAKALVHKAEKLKRRKN